VEPPFSPERSGRLLARAQAGDPGAREAAVRANLGLVRAAARRLQRPGVEYDDLFQAGCIGLLKAVDGFDPRRGVRFSTYAVPVIIGEMRRWAREQHPVRLPRGLADVRRRALACREALAQRLSREPAVGEIAGELQVSPEDVAEALAAERPVASLDEPPPGAGADAAPLAQRLPADGGEERLVENAALKAALAQLADWERRLILLRFFEGFSQAETARALGVSQPHVSRTERRLLRRFRDAFS